MYIAGALLSALLGILILTLAYYSLYFVFWFLASFFTGKGSLIGRIACRSMRW